MYDTSESEIYEYLPSYISDLVKAGVLDETSMVKGTSRFVKVIPDLISDIPKLASYFSQTLFALLDNQAFDPKDIVWIEPPKQGANEDEEDLVFVEAYFKLIAEFLILLY